MTAYETKDALAAAYAAKLVLNGVDSELAKMVTRDKPRYRPHLYRGGFVIPGFGFSIERVGKFVSWEKAGCPLSAGEWNPVAEAEARLRA